MLKLFIYINLNSCLFTFFENRLFGLDICWQRCHDAIVLVVRHYAKDAVLLIFPDPVDFYLFVH